MRTTVLSTFLYAGLVPALAVADPETTDTDEPTLEELVAESEKIAEAEGEVIVVDDRAPAEAASSVHFDGDELRRRPLHGASDLLRQTPGLVVSQHAGGGKADQYFLRGFDADHGTDVALFVDGVPVNLTSHGHGQGYADAHWIIPETIAGVDVHKGPYAARFGDFYTAGAIELRTIDDIERPTLWLTGGTELGGPVAGQRLSSRMVGMATPQVAGGKALLAAEIGDSDGPFIAPQDFRRGAAMAKWRRDLGAGTLKLSSSYYTASWNQSGQIPEAEVAAGRLDRFGSIDPTEGGSSTRASVAAGYEVQRPGARWTADAYAVDYRLNLFSNFTLYARDPIAGDQIEQNDDRLMLGASTAYQRTLGGDGPVQALVTAGVQARADDTTADLWHTSRRARVGDCFDNPNPCNRAVNRIRNLAAYVEADVAVKNKVHLLPGLRVDGFAWSVDDRDPETMASPQMTTGGDASAAIVSPKLSAIWHASGAVNVFANAGRGFHSNDARAAVATRGHGALAAAWGAEIGTRVRPTREIRASLAAWYLHLASEQVWSGDLGGTEASDPTRRHGIDADLSWDAAPWLALDGNVAIARSSFVANRGNGGALALAPRVMGGGGVTLHGDKSSLSLRARGIDDRPANEDGTLTAKGYLLLDVVAARRIGRAELKLTVNNLLDAEWREAQFAEESRPTPMGEVVEDVHFTPGMPLTALLTLGMSY